MATTKKSNSSKKSTNPIANATSSMASLIKTAADSANSGSMTETNKTTTQYAPYQNPASVSFDSNAWKQAYIDQMVSELTSNYNTDKANLDKTYNTNITNYNNQLNDTNMSYDANIQALQRQKYEDTQQAKNEAFSRGLGFGGLGQAIEQTARNNANNKIADTQNERSRAINDIYTLINQAKYNYGIDSDTLLKNFNADKLKYMSTAEIQALEKKLQVDMYNTDWTNKFLQDSNNRTFTSSENDKKYNWQSGENALDREFNANQAQLNRDFSASEAQKDRDVQTALAKLQAKLYGSGGSRYSSGSSSKLTKDQEYNLAKNYLEKNGIDETDELSDALFGFMRGTITSDKLWSIIDNAVAEKRNANSTKPSTGGGAGGGGGGAWVSDESSNPLFKFLSGNSNSIPFGHGLNAKIPYSKRK